jgi:hypothetical protein
MGRPESPVWQELYRDAMFETDRQKVSERIVLAEAAIDSRLQQMSQGPPSEDARAMEYALSQLSLLRRTVV